MNKILIAFVIVLVCSIIVAEGYKSVRVKKPETEEEREAHHIMHRNMRAKKFDLKPDAPEVDPNHPETPKRKYKSPSYHFAYGPEYPDHSNIIEYKSEPRYHNGEQVPDFVSDDELLQHFQ